MEDDLAITDRRMAEGGSSLANEHVADVVEALNRYEPD